jgi:hypothetical protein
MASGGKKIDPTLKAHSRLFEGVTYIPEGAYIPAYGGINLSRHHSLLPLGGFSNIQNMRPNRPGFEKRKGQSALHSTADSTNKAVNLGAFSKGKKSELKFYAQMSDGDVLQATANPPGTTVGVFGSSVYTSASPSTMLPASFTTMLDRMIYADGTGVPYMYSGATEYVKQFVVLKSAAAIPVIPIQGEDFTIQVTDGTTSTVAVLDSLSVLTDYDAIYIRTDVPADTFTFTLNGATKGNTTASAAQMHYWNGAWAAVTALNDGTELLTLDVAPATPWLAGQTITGQTSTKSALIVAVTTTTTYQISGRTGAFTLGEVLTNGTVTADQGAAHPQVATLGYTGTMSFTMTTDHKPHYMFGSAGYWYRLSLASGALDAEVELTSVTFESDWSAIQNTWDTAPISCPESYLYIAANTTYKFYEGTAISVGGMTSSDKLYIGFASPLLAIYFDVGAVPNAVDATMTIKYNQTGNTWTTTGAVDCTTIGSQTLGQNGWVTFVHPADEQPTLFQSSVLYQYWYEITVSATLTASMVLYVTGMPYQDLTEFGTCYNACAWRNRVSYAFSDTPGYVAISATHQPMVLNGSDFAFQEIGDGRENKVVAQACFHSELMVWQEEKGKEGGTLTLIQGYNPETYGRYVISNKYGTFSQKSVVVIEGVPISTVFSGSQESGDATFAFFLSRHGVCVSDGRKVKLISYPINKYFDQRETDCIRLGYEKEMWIGYDSSSNVIRVGLVTGASATTCNTFLIYDVLTGFWSHDVLSQELSAYIECEAGSGQSPVVQVGGGVDDGLIYLLNTGTNDVSTAIDAFIIPELDVSGYPTTVRDLFLRCATQATTSLRSATYAWTLSTATSSTTEYYCRTAALGDPSLSEPIELILNTIRADKGILGSLNPSEWSYGDNDSLGYSTIYVRLSDGTDPDTKSAAYVSAAFTGVIVTPYINNVAQTATTLSMAVEVTGESLRRNRFTVNTTGDHVALKIQNNTLSQPFEILDYGLELLVYREQ